MTTTVETVDLRDSYRIEVTPTILRRGSYGAQLYQRMASSSGPLRYRWKKVSPVVIAASPERAERDMSQAINLGLLKGVKVKG